MSRLEAGVTVAVVAIVCATLLSIIALAIADGQNWRQQCVASGGYVVQQGGSQPVCVR